MANIKSAIKRHKQSLKRRARNRAVRSRVKTFIKTFRRALEEGDLQKAKELFPVVMKEVHKAASKGVIHKNNAARKISRLARLIEKAEKQAEAS
ncbi:MAG: 30S ribosomal protein S20 [Deltaproteobacteria bacterium]|nr:MAG: 30S ribosomal protein S20 [Deltaproteobacteria bacterium]